jgi:hypothetical protein
MAPFRKRQCRPIFWEGILPSRISVLTRQFGGVPLASQACCRVWNPRRIDWARYYAKCFRLEGSYPSLSGLIGLKPQMLYPKCKKDGEIELSDQSDNVLRCRTGDNGNGVIKAGSILELANGELSGEW